MLDVRQLQHSETLVYPKMLSQQKALIADKTISLTFFICNMHKNALAGLYSKVDLYPPMKTAHNIQTFHTYSQDSLFQIPMVCHTNKIFYHMLHPQIPQSPFHLCKFLTIPQTNLAFSSRAFHVCTAPVWSSWTILLMCQRTHSFLWCLNSTLPPSKSIKRSLAFFFNLVLYKLFTYWLTNISLNFN